METTSIASVIEELTESQRNEEVAAVVKKTSEEIIKATGDIKEGSLIDTRDEFYPVGVNTIALRRQILKELEIKLLPLRG